MASILTINEVISFPDTISTTVIGTEEALIEGRIDKAETRFFKSPENEEMVEGYGRYNIKHTQKYKIDGRLRGEEFKEIMRIIKITTYKQNNVNYLFSLGSAKADYAHFALKRLRINTEVKTKPLEIDLISTVEKIIKSSPDIKISSGWFSNLGLSNLNNALLQGEEVNLGPDWAKFKATAGASLSNIELIIDDTDFTQGYVKISLSKRGVIFSRRKLSPEKILSIANKIIAIII